MTGGLDLGGTKIQAVVTAGGRGWSGRRAARRPRSAGGEAVALELAGALRAARRRREGSSRGVAGVGVGAPGSIDGAGGKVMQVANIAGLDGPFPLGPSVEDELGRPVAIGNDVTSRSRPSGASAPGAASSPSSASSGVRVSEAASSSTGGSSTDAAPPARSATSARARVAAAATAGSTAVSKRTPDGARSRSAPASWQRPRHGPVRAHGASGAATASRAASGCGRFRRATRSREELIREAVEALGVGIGSAVTLLDVEAVMIGGGLGERLGPSGSRASSRQRKPHVLPDHPVYRLAELGDMGGAIGASLSALRVAIVTGAGRGMGAAVARRLTRTAGRSCSAISTPTRSRC